MDQQTAKTAALYCRTANIDTFAVKKQLEKLRQFAEAQGLAYQVYSDNGYKGLDFERPAFRQMLQDIEAGKINMIISLRFDRYGRNTFETASILHEQIDRNKIEVISLHEGNLTTSICSGQLLYNELAQKNKDNLSR